MTTRNEDCCPFDLGAVTLLIDDTRRHLTQRFQLLLAMVILQCDKAYYRWAILIVRSLSLHEPVIKVYVDTLNLHADEIRELERAHPNITVTNAATAERMTRRDEMACGKAVCLSWSH